MFGFASTKNNDNLSGSISSEDESDDDFSMRDMQTVQSEQRDDGFSFFGFKLFEAEETIQDDHFNLDINNSDDYESVAEQSQIQGSRSDLNSSGRPFWKPRIKHPKKSSDLSDPIPDKNYGRINNVPTCALKRIMKGSKAMRAFSDRAFAKSKNVHNSISDDRYECRDDSVRSHNQSSDREMFDTASRDGNDMDILHSSSKRCFPSFGLKKQETPIPVVPLATIKETVRFDDTTKSPSQKRRTDKYCIPEDGYVSRHTEPYRHGRYKLKESQSKYVKGSSTRPYIKQSDVKPSYTNSYDTWDDESSGWFSLESLDAR